MVLKESGFKFQPTRNGLRLMRVHNVTFSMLACHGKGGEIIQMQHIYHYGDTQFAIQGQVIIRYFQT